MSPDSKMGLVLLTLNVLISHRTFAIQVYNFCMETDNEIIFRSSLRNNTEYDYEMYSGHLECLFHHNEELTGKHCLKAGQIDRFTVKANKTDDELTVTLTVRDVREEDNGLYILFVAGGRDGERYQEVVDTYVDVVTPPGPAVCENVSSSYSPDWIEMHCSAPLGMTSDPQGSIACFQNGKMAPFRSQPAHSVDSIQAIFWMDVESSINCCSFAPQCEKASEMCLDFTYSEGIRSVEESNNWKSEEIHELQESATSVSTLLFAESLENSGQRLATAFFGSIFCFCFYIILQL